ncbi:unnamed protein product [Bursaphelenchus xylophilus]|uniref:Replication protein A subunit n=1 Tax=Bursaphelenchus xylophilus TaxID=6326 RepID=A0A1I7RKB6_BURXY|nr:unnamed protein product [Bursaphelenchus xylophilus]CAG9131391.1 unnamed protein product [Bursaphelenchus xylophilus]
MTENLDRGFFQHLLDNSATAKKNPVLQVLELRKYGSGNASSNSVAFRARMSDSQFTYSNCIGSPEVYEVLENQGVLNSRPIIRVNSYTSNDNNGKRLFCMVNVEVLEDSAQQVGQPIPHSGNPNDYRGMDTMEISTASSPSRKRVAASMNATTPSKKATPQGGVFGQRVFAIKDISPYVNNFLLCGLCQSKEQIRQVNTKRGPSNILNFTLIDDAGSSIRISVWGDQATQVDQILEEGQTYYVNCQGSGCVRESNKRFNATGHPYELSLNSSCTLEPCIDRVVAPTSIKLNPIPLSDIKMHANECVDLVGVIDTVDEVSTVNAKDGRTLHKRNVGLIDDSKTQVQLTLWEDDAHSFDYQPGEVVCVKGASVREFNGGFSLSVSKAQTQIFPSPPEDSTTESLQKWFIQERPNAEVASISGGDAGGSLERDFKSIGVVQASGMANSTALDDRGIYINIKAMVNGVKTENAFYQSCKQCRKKVNVVDNTINCDRCGPGVEAKYVYMLSLEVADFTGVCWLTLFDEAAQSLLQISADELQQMYTDDRESYDAVFDRIRFSDYIFRCRIKYETFNDRQNLRWTAMQVNPVNYDRLCGIFQRSLEKIDQL